MTGRTFKIGKCVGCGLEKEIPCRRLCNACYHKAIRKGTIEIAKREGTKKPRRCIDCGKTTMLQGRGRCLSCYNCWYSSKPEVKRRRARQEKARRRAKPKIYKEYDRRRAKSPRRLAWRARYNREYYAENAEHLKEYQRQYQRRRRREGLSQESEYKRRYRGRKQGLAVTLTLDEWEEILNQHRHLCIYCGTGDQELVREHWIPVSRGGGYTKKNMVPACSRCNSRKGQMTGDEFFGLLDLEEWTLLEQLFEAYS